KQVDKVNERIGRLKGKYPSIHRHYDITVESQPAPDAPSKKKKKQPTLKESVASDSDFGDLETEKECRCKRPHASNVSLL
ncbi:MAG: hypothetical protein RR331_04065, partial [Bacteroides sp.]